MEDGYLGLPRDISIGSNTPGTHPASTHRPIHYDEWAKPSASGYQVSDTMINEALPDKPFKILMIGAGAAGIDFLHHAPPALAHLGVEIKCYEKNADVGGTWYENRYPGCACDVPSVSYQLPWRPNTEWTSYYSGAKEIWQYFKTVVQEEGMMKYISLGVQVRGATWEEAKSKWIVSLSKTASLRGVTEWKEEFDFILNGTGFLKYVRWPRL